MGAAEFPASICRRPGLPSFLPASRESCGAFLLQPILIENQDLHHNGDISKVPIQRAATSEPSCSDELIPPNTSLRQASGGAADDGQARLCTRTPKPPTHPKAAHVPQSRQRTPKPPAYPKAARAPQSRPRTPKLPARRALLEAPWLCEVGAGEQHPLWGGCRRI